MMNKETKIIPMTPCPNEKTLMQQAIAGSGEAFGTLYEYYYPYLLSYAIRQVRDPDMAEDLVQKTFMKCWRAIGKYQHRCPYSAYLITALKHQIADWLSARHRDKSCVSIEEMAYVYLTSQEPDILHTYLIHDVLLTAINQLPQEQRLVVCIKLELGNAITNADIAHWLATITDKPTSEGAIKTLYHRALLNLRRKLIGLGWGVDDIVVKRG